MATSPQTLGEWLNQAAGVLRSAGVPSPAAEARRLVMRALRWHPAALAARLGEPVPEDARRRLAEWLERRARREPLQYLAGWEDFWGRPFYVNPGVLIPRPETEQVVAAALGLPVEPGARVLDVGAGSGCIGITLALERPEWDVTALEPSAEAVAVVRRNVRELAPGRVRLVQGTLAALAGEWDLVVSNPPYVGEDELEALMPEVRDHEPREALVAGEGGLAVYRGLLGWSRCHLAPGGWLVLELGHRSLRGVRRLMTRTGGLREVRVEEDPCGIPRVFVARRGSVRVPEDR